jgi:hypothetical protein
MALFGAQADLVQIRNWLVHADLLPDEAYPHLFVAVQHLGWIFERILVAILKWPLDKTSVAWDSLLAYPAGRDWTNAKAELARLRDGREA